VNGKLVVESTVHKFFTPSNEVGEIKLKKGPTTFAESGAQ